MTKKSIIEIKDLEISINDKVLNKFSSFNIEGGSFVEIEGENGSGKSTFLKLFHRYGSYYKTNNGELNINGKNIYDIDDDILRRNIVLIEQEDESLSNQSVYDYLTRRAKTCILHDPKVNKKEKFAELEGKCEEIYNKFIYKLFKEDKPSAHFKSIKYKYIKKFKSLSGGQKKILHILQGIVQVYFTDYKIVLMDEPLNNLDKNNKQFLVEIIKEIREEFPEMIFIVISHCRVFPFINAILKIESIDNHENRVSYEVLSSKFNFYDCLTK